MTYDFDLNGRRTKPLIILTNPNKINEIGSIAHYEELQIRIRFNQISELSFSTPSATYDKEKFINLEIYKEIKEDKLIHIPEYGWFVIKSVSESQSTKVMQKKIQALSYECMLNDRGANLLKGTYKFYDPVSPSDTLMGVVLKNIPRWKVGYVDPSLFSKYRTFDKNSDSKLYGFLMNDVEKAYECFFEYDTENLIINVYTAKGYIKPTDISLSLNNLINTITIDSKADDVCTVLSVSGAGNMDIRTVNPIGNNNIYDFSEYMNSDYMSSGLISAIKNWNIKIEQNQTLYANLLADLKTKNLELLELQVKLKDLEGELSALRVVQTEQVTTNKIDPTLANKIIAKESEIAIKKTELAGKETQVSNITNNLTAINANLKFENNFSKAHLLELDCYIKEASYSNEHYVQTKNMTNAQIIDMSLQLYNQGKSVISKCAHPTYSFIIDSQNFLFIEKFKPFIDQLELGSIININVNDQYWVAPVLLEISIDYDNPEKLGLTFSNRYRLGLGEWTWDELQNEVVRSSQKVSSVSPMWDEEVGTNNVVTEYLNNNLNTANQEIINSKSQEIMIGEYGLLCREKLSTGAYSPNQLRLAKNLICMTKDNWHTSSLAIGLVNGVYSVNAGILAGNLVASNELIISNKNNTFRVDALGASLTNAYFELITKNKLGRIILDPRSGDTNTSGIKIQTRTSEIQNWTDSFYVDMSGKIIANDIICTRGTIGGFDILSDRIASKATSAPWHGFDKLIDLRSDGTGRIGLMAWDWGNAWFNGNIFAKNLDKGGFDWGTVYDKFQNGSFSHDKVDGQFDEIIANTIRAKRIFAEYGEFNELVADVGRINNLVATKASITDLKATTAKIDNLAAKAITTDNLSAQKISANQITAGLMSVNRISMGGIPAKWTPLAVVWDVVKKPLRVVTNVKLVSGKLNLEYENIDVIGTVVRGWLDYIGTNRHLND